MLLTRPKEYELVIDSTTDYIAALTAISTAALRNGPTILRNVERTPLLAKIEPVLATAGVSLEWSEHALNIFPEDQKPLEYLDPIDDYDMFKYLLILAATRTGSKLSLVEELDDTVQMIVLALRRMGAELEFRAGKTPHVEVLTAISREMKYHLKRENAKIVPQLVIAMAAQGGASELMDLFDGSRFDYIFERFIADFQRRDLTKVNTDDELERRLAKRAPKVSEFKSHVTVTGGFKSGSLELTLRPDSEFAAYLAASVISHSKAKLILKNVIIEDISSTPLAQLRRMGVEVVSQREGGTQNLVITHSEVKSRSVNYDQLHDYPDSVGAIALANSRAGGTAVIRSSPFNTEREEARRKAICNLIRNLGLKVAEIKDGIVLEGRDQLSADTISTGNDAVCALMAAAAPLGAVPQLEVDDLSAASERWGSNFNRVIELVAAKS